jgi:hypothetical protein
MELTDKDIRNNPFLYNEERLLYNLKENNLSLRLVSRYQKLTAYMCAKYIIFGGNDEKYGDCCEDRWISDYNILCLQPHLSQNELSNAHIFVLNEELNEKKELENMKKEDKYKINK